MKCDKILFGLACLGMGAVLHSTLSKNPEPFADYQPRVLLEDSIKIQQALDKDTVSFSKVLEKDSVNLLKKIR